MKYPQLVSMPSAVSDWLEEQLEARGIDAVLYTRYILSLLHSDDTVDVIYSDEDLHFSHLKKEVRRSGGSRKRFRRSSDWWRHAQADAEKLKRSAAVECLMSASEQTCGIESLIDELCDKLNEIKSDAATTDLVVNPPPPRSSSSPSSIKKHIVNSDQLQQVSPQELAKRYYAAFPALNGRNSKSAAAAASPSKLIQLIPKWLPSPKKKANCAKVTATIKTTNRKLNSDSSGSSTMKASRSVGKQPRFGAYFTARTNNNTNLCGNLMNGNKKMDLSRPSEGMNNNLNNFNHNHNNNDWNIKMKKSRLVNEVAELRKEEKILNDRKVTDDDWKLNDDDDEMMYDDLPVDIKELLDDEDEHDSLNSHDFNVEMMNLANVRDSSGKRFTTTRTNNFISCGTNIQSSIWTMAGNVDDDTAIYDNKFNSAMIAAATQSDSILDLQFSSITINNQNEWLDGGNETMAKLNDFAFVEDNERNNYFERCQQQQKLWEYPTSTIMSGGCKWSENSGCNDDDNATSNHHQLTISLMKLNHDRDSSPFAEVAPNSTNPNLFATATSSSSFSKIIGPSSSKVDVENKEAAATKDDLLTSVHSHFRPINEKVDNYLHSQYADGSTFVITNTWDKINYTRTNSGGLYMENDFGLNKKYCEYNMKSTNNNNVDSKSLDFVLKFLVCQNDMACQTEDDDNNDDDDAEVESTFQQETVEKSTNCLCRTLATNLDKSWIVNKLCLSKNWKKCECNNNNNISSKANVWNVNGLENKYRCDNTEWDNNTLRDIWTSSSGDICQTCIKSSHSPPSSLQNSKLREDVMQDGDQLLSDLHSLTKTYMNSEAEDDDDEDALPENEYTCDFVDFRAPKERKRRHSLITATAAVGPITTTQSDEVWSFASRLEEDCLMQLSTIPTLRSVTL